MSRAQHDSADPSDAASDPIGRGSADDRDRDADRVGDLRSDLASDPASDLASDLADLRLDVEAADEVVWFEAEALAAASRVELGDAKDSVEGPLEVPLLEQLRARLGSPGISLAELPSWPRGETIHPGPALGPALADLLGELRAGDLILVSGRGRGVGRTTLLSQLADALALRSASPQSPVICMVEGPAVDWRARSLARWAGLDVRRFSMSGVPDVTAELEAFAAGDWRGLDARQRFVDASLLREGARRVELLDRIDHWRSDHARDVWPVLVIDPIEQLAPKQVSLADLERLAGDHGLIVLASCDDPEPADARRLDRHAQARLRLSASGEALEIELCHRRLGPTASARLRWDRASGRIGGP